MPKSTKFFYLIILVFLFSSNISFAGARIVDGFDYPVGPPNGSGFYDAQDVNEWNLAYNAYHLGEDWNKECGGDCDLGNPVYSIGIGEVVLASHKSIWGNVVIIRHTLNNGKQIDSMYAHLKEMKINEGSVVNRGQQIGTIGKGANNRFPAHLHFELRDNINIGIGSGYGQKNQSGYLNPHIFINSHRPIKPSTLTAVSAGSGKVNLSWTKSEDSGFDKYEIYRSPVAGGTLDPGSRTLIHTSSDINFLATVDDKATSPGTYYYRVLNYSKSGLTAESNEVSIDIAREYINITNHPAHQWLPTIDGNIVVWQDDRSVGFGDTHQIHYYDINEGKKKEIDIQMNTLTSGAQMPFVKGKYAIYYAQDKTFSSTHSNIYAVNMETGNPFLITNAPREQMTPVISDNGIAVWSDLRSGNLDLYYKDLNKPEEGEKLFVQAANNQRSPRIWGNKVVWKDSRVGNRHDLYLKEIGGQEVLLANNVGDGTPDIWENWVVWQYKGKISIMDINTKKIKEIVTSKGNQTVRVRDGKVAYSVYDGENNYIHIYDIANNKDTKLDYPLINPPSLAISQNNLVFDKLEPNTIINTDIYLTRL